MIYNAALYMRLSRDDMKFGDSASIETQRAILRQFTEQQHIMVYDEYVDDGWSGTSFERPAFQRMMRDIEAGKVNCVITKDLSRFGREHIMMDYYLEMVFPKYRVRYIAVTENEDTAQGLSDFVPFKNLFNEWYAKDTSRKIRAALGSKYAAGEYISPRPPFGYIKDPAQPKHLIPDPETAWVVQHIFALAATGMGIRQIASQLKAAEIPVPSWWHKHREGRQALPCEPAGGKFGWTNNMILHIMKKEIYIGNIVHYQQRAISYKNHRRIRTPADEWLRIENTHEPLVDVATFNRVQELIQLRGRPKQDFEPALFAGKLRCADCGQLLIHGSHQNIPYYRCCVANNNPGRCTSHYINEKTLSGVVLERLQHWIAAANLDEGELLSQLQTSQGGQRDTPQDYLRQSTQQYEKRLAEIERLIQRLYEDWAAGRIAEANMNMLVGKYQAEQANLNDKLRQVEGQLTAAGDDQADMERWVKLIRKYTQPDTLTREMVIELIDKIVVHQATKDADGKRHQRIEIYYRFIGKVD